MVTWWFAKKVVAQQGNRLLLQTASKNVCWTECTPVVSTLAQWFGDTHVQAGLVCRFRYQSYGCPDVRETFCIGPSKPTFHWFWQM